MIEKITEFLKYNFGSYSRKTPEKMRDEIVKGCDADDLCLIIASDSKINSQGFSEYRNLKDFINTYKIYVDSDASDFGGNFHYIRNIIGARVLTKDKCHGDAMQLKNELTEVYGYYFESDNNTDFLTELADLLTDLKNEYIDNFVRMIYDLVSEFLEGFNCDAVDYSYLKKPKKPRKATLKELVIHMYILLIYTFRSIIRLFSEGKTRQKAKIKATGELRPSGGKILKSQKRAEIFDTS